MTITVRFRCGHTAMIDPDKTPAPVCDHCGDRRVAGTVGVGAPRIVGHARGPLVEERHLGPTAVSLAEKPFAIMEQADADDE